MNIKEIAMKHACEYLTFKLGGHKGCDIQEIVEDDEIYADIVSELAEQFEALVAELAKGNEPVARICSGWQLLFIGSDSIAEVARKHSLKIGDALYTLPPTAEQIEQETAEAIAKMCDLIYGNGSAASQAARDGSWRTCK